MSLFFLIKFLHLIGTAVLLGTGVGIAFFFLLAHRSAGPSKWSNAPSSIAS